jgi:hypothetical protein
MHARQKLNGVYAWGAVVWAGIFGAVANSWWAFGAGLAVLLGLYTWAGSIRLAPDRRTGR